MQRSEARRARSEAAGRHQWISLVVMRGQVA